MKLRKLHIDDYKMFKNFDISFVDENDEALPIVVLAGLNGSGKTTLLESMVPHWISTQKLEISMEKYDLVLKLKNTGGSSFLVRGEVNQYYPNIDFSKAIIYFPASVNQLQDIEIKIVEEYIKTAEEIDSFKEALNSLQKKIDDIFTGLNIGFRVSRVDYNKKKVFLSDIDNNVEFGMDTLSTGEKTLLSKLLLLYFAEYQEKIILIDEPELSLHPSWQNKVLKLYENFALKNNCQIIIATHSPHIIGSAKPEYLRVLKKVEDKIEVVQYTQSYGLEFSQILTDIMGVDYLRTPDVAKRLEGIKTMIVEDTYDSEKFQSNWKILEEVLGKNYLDLKLLKLEIASRRKNASNN